MKPQVIVCVFNHLATDQRVEKVCSTLHTAGYPILLVGNNWKGLPPLQRPYEVCRISLKSRSLKTAYAEFQWKLYRLLQQKATDNTIVLANDLDVLTACFKFSKKKKIPLVYDSHEIFTEIPDIQGRFTQKIWRYLENSVIRKIPYIMTESHGYAQWFVQKYNIPLPVVIGNLPRRYSLEESSEPSDKKIVIYQGAVKAFRGIEEAILAIKLLPDCELWIVGDGPKKKTYESFAKENAISNVRFWGNQIPEKLRQITPRADVGLSLEENAGLSYYLSLPNKVADYIQAGVPLVGTDFPETGRIIKKYGVGVRIAQRSPQHISQKIKEVLDHGKGYYSENLSRAAEKLCWEAQEEKILKLFERVCKDYQFL